MTGCAPSDAWLWVIGLLVVGLAATGPVTASEILAEASGDADWYAPEGSDEAVFVGDATQGDPQIVVNKAPIARGAVLIELTTDSSQCVIESAGSQLAIEIEPDTPNQLTLNGDRLHPRVKLQNLEVAALRGRWIRMVVMGDGETLTLRFVGATYVNLRFAGPWQPRGAASAHVPSIGAGRSSISAAASRATATVAYSSPDVFADRSMTISPDGGVRRMSVPPVPAPHASPAPAQSWTAWSGPVEIDSENQWSVSLAAGIGTTNTYIYRGIMQENQEKIIQPWMTGTITVFEADDSGILRQVDIDMGFETSHHYGPSGRVLGEKFYEIDWFGGATFHLFERWTVAIHYNNRENISNAFQDIHQANFLITYDDRDAQYSFCLSPYALISIEGEGESDAGGIRIPGLSTSKGVYLELGVRPVFDVKQIGPNQMITLAVPAAIGLGISDYYEDATGDDDVFGFFDIGVELDIPMAVLVAADAGRQFNFSLVPTLHVVVLGDTAEALSKTRGGGGDSVEVIGSVGMEVTY